MSTTIPHKKLDAIYREQNIQNALSLLDINKIHIVYFSYYLNWHNFIKTPLLLATKILNCVTRQKFIDHVAHICNFDFDKNYKLEDVKIFEATVKYGMVKNSLLKKLSAFQGICYVETINQQVDKVKAREFESQYYGVPYSKTLAAISGIDIKFLDKAIKPPKGDGGFCSWLEALFLINQDIDIKHIEKGEAIEITPADIYHGDLGQKKILFKY